MWNKFIYIVCFSWPRVFNRMLNKKSQELNDFTEKHDLKIWRQRDASSLNDDVDKKLRTGNVLVVSSL